MVTAHYVLNAFQDSGDAQSVFSKAEENRNGHFVVGTSIELVFKDFVMCYSAGNKATCSSLKQSKLQRRFTSIFKSNLLKIFCGHHLFSKPVYHPFISRFSDMMF